jgi:hypothetical protein
MRCMCLKAMRETHQEQQDQDGQNSKIDQPDQLLGHGLGLLQSISLETGLDDGSSVPRLERGEIGTRLVFDHLDLLVLLVVPLEEVLNCRHVVCAASCRGGLDSKT